MSFNKKKSINNSASDNISDFNKLMADDFNIKSYLNTSLELSGISVSEELINKTLEAINKQEEQPEADPVLKTEGTDKVSKTRSGRAEWYGNIRIIAGAAAAVIILAVGMKFLSGPGGFASKNSMDNSTGAIVAEDRAEDRDEDIAEDTLIASNPTAVPSPNVSVAENGELFDQEQVPSAKESDFAYGIAEADTSIESADQTATISDEDTSAEIADPSSQAASDTAADALTGASTGAGNSDTAKSTAPPKLGAERVTKIPADTANVADIEIPADSEIPVGTENLADSETPADNENLTDSKTLADSETPAANELEDAGNGSDTVQGIVALQLNDELSFQDILPILPEEVSVITITELTGNTVVTLTSLSDIQNFYTAMDQLKFSEGEQTPVTISYTIEVTGKDTQGVLFTMKIGDTILVSSTAGNTKSIYNPQDTDALQKCIAGYFE